MNTEQEDLVTMLGQNILESERIGDVMSLDDLLAILDKNAANKQDTANMLVSMLTENTGRSPMDSGGIPKYDANGCYIGSEYGYGRSYERNQCRTFEGEPAATLTFKWGYVKYTHNLYHWLLERVEYENALDSLFHHVFVPWYEHKHGDQYWLSLMRAFPGWLSDHFDIECSGIYGDGDTVTVNTYNHESLLSDVIQFTYFESELGCIYLLQTHNGADVRGGYTRPRVFSENGKHSEPSLFFDAHAHISCDSCHANWYTDDAYHWYPDSDRRDLQLEKLTIIEQDKEEEEGEWQTALDEHKQALAVSKQEPDTLPLFPHEDIRFCPPPPPDPVLFVDQDGDATCPVCFDGILEA